jgi:hypothetical protein
MEQSTPFEAKSQEVARLLCNPMVHYCVHSSPPLVPLLNQMQSIYTFHFLPKNHTNITFPSTSRSSDLCLPFSRTDQNFVFISYLFTKINIAVCPEKKKEPIYRPAHRRYNADLLSVSNQLTNSVQRYPC